jgi:hypothetical protein
VHPTQDTLELVQQSYGVDMPIIAIRADAGPILEDVSDTFTEPVDFSRLMRTVRRYAMP